MSELTPQKGQEPGWIGMVCQMFTGPRAWLGWVMLVLGLVVFALAIYTAVEFMAAETVMSAIRWGMGLLIAVLMMGTVKVLSWMLIIHEDITRRLKGGGGSHGGTE